MKIRRKGKISEGEWVVLFDSKRRYLIQVEREKIFHFHKGYIRHNDIIGMEEGSIIRSSQGANLLVLRPTYSDFILEMPRGAQIIYPKDIATILVWADIYPGARVLEAGIGSGALTIALLQAVGETGTVISYEIREDFAKRALSNIENFLGKKDNHILRLKDIYEEIIDENIDRIILDLPEPWRAIDNILKALRPGGIFLAYTPTIIQAQKTVEALKGTKSFTLIETIETLLRPWQIEGLSVRPFHRMVAHTAFLTVARRIVTQEENISPMVVPSEERGENYEIE
ncbi:MULTISPECIES: tRNA (adenine-N1)-methyltransferase [Dictyoglomus]|jgi:tRNA (adenine57-N1/adenine58-N1)-methyltransferase|uniref:tRNA (adenine(58)-N(1))-methyltransferase TrmI n=1 Tax=Dictyoglomus turgidum (strain DSM 6724 / Z-1310) TaxID=515635 RepID=B8E2N0_DICTD|nr:MULTISPECIES: tRNA (adenine-N1)-methyltransferase [Dictyoglomus]ACK42874.1 tRNA (adenine-N(1)-)-methyltransferase [Dictyoglomus turgidum DSM 6724]HBU30936.1 tRNA (adenine-N1)-methyltransferase [Dictyoglomus sp.]